MRHIELLSPARDAEVARQAILHGADAVYMGPPTHGARKSAANSLDDIRRTVDFAHQFRAKVYATVNTIIYETELRSVERLITDLYRIGVDALIVQDMGILRLDIPPIALHASTQCDNRSIEKVRFLQEVGFSQIVLARELTLTEITEICQAVTIPIEVFVHGALCVSYSGRCHASYHACGRSANRGECAQLCRLPYTLTDRQGKVLSQSQHLLSLKDFNASDRLTALLDAGVSSLKIEGRLKDADYVKNVTAYYRQRLDKIIETHPTKYARSSFGTSQFNFTPAVEKSFNRSFTHYFLDSSHPQKITSPLTPKSLGEPINSFEQIHNGDGISWFDRSGKYCGALVNGKRDGKLILSDGTTLTSSTKIFRTSDVQFQKELNRPTAKRKINVDISLDQTGVTARDERGIEVRLPLDISPLKALKPNNPKVIFEKLGNTIYQLREFSSSLSPEEFLPPSQLTVLRRHLTDVLDAANIDSYIPTYRGKENFIFPYPQETLDFRDNVANSLAEKFYKSHGVKRISSALETGGKLSALPVMTTRHCILRELGKCKKRNLGKDTKLCEPLILNHGNRRYRLKFDCARCEMQLLPLANI